MAQPDLRSPAALVQAIEEAVGCYRQGRLADAEKLCNRVLKARPDAFDALHLLGVIRLDSGKAGAALGVLESALRINPNVPPALLSLARTQSALHRDAEALATIDKALALAPNSYEALNSRGVVLLKLNRAAEALPALERAAAIEPRFLGSRLNLGNALNELGRHADALAQYDAMLAVSEAQPDVHYSRGNALSALGRATHALAAYDRALALKPDFPKALLSRGAVLMALNRYRDALADFGAVLARDKTNADAQHNAALSWLTLGELKQGFEIYESRWQRSGMAGKRPSLGKPLWLGEYPLARKTILIHAEQGLGDTIQFARYAPILARAGAKVVLEVQPELTGLMSRLAGVSEVVARGAARPSFDVHCPVGSLPRALRTELSGIPADTPYLSVSEERLAKWRPRLEALPGPRIAFAWSGNPNHANDRNRSLALNGLAPLLASEHASFISIQRDLRDGDAAALAQMPRVTHVGGELDDFDDTAAVMALADLVISVDTSVVHLAGALGRPTWILVPFAPDWRWLLDREDSPWYPDVRLFRQPAPGDWPNVVARVTDELAQMPVSRAERSV
jgi:tetratricopeptide (TPR) repeat protein